MRNRYRLIRGTKLAATALMSQNSKVRARGFEPPRDYLPQGPQPCASANSATPAFVMVFVYAAREVSQIDCVRQRPWWPVMPMRAELIAGLRDFSAYEAP